MKTKFQNIKSNYKLILGVLILGLVIGWIIAPSGNTNNVEDKHADHNHEEETTVWTCSMHPQIKQDKPGLCPICAMDLIPLSSMKGGEHTDPNEIVMSESAAKLADIQTSKVVLGEPTKSIYMQGKLNEDERQIAKLTARFGGRIEELFVNFTGQEVRKGQKLATIYSPNLISAQRELIEASEFKHENPSLYKAARAKLKAWDLSESQIDNIERSGEPEVNFDVLSPLTGTVIMRHVALGDYVREGTALFKVADLTKLWVLFDAYETDLPWIKVGDKISFTLQALPGEEFKTKVTYIDPIIDAKTRVAKVRAEINNKDLRLKPEMFTNGVLQSKIAEGQTAVIIPKTAVLWTGKRAVVYTKVRDRESPTFLYREIVLGPEAGAFYVVKDGLEPGEEIATNGVFKIDAAAQLIGLPSMMNPQVVDASTGHNHGEMNMNEQAERNMQYAMFNVSGNCGMCEETIEAAAMSLNGVTKADWSQETHMIHVKYNANKVKLADIHKAIAKSGYDTELETALDDVYQGLPECCHYARTSSDARKVKIQDSMFKVYGNCGMCKDRIEEAAQSVWGIKSAEWNEDSKMMHVSYLSDKTILDKIHKAIAKVGHDTEKEKAPDEVYNNLPACCLYRE